MTCIDCDHCGRRDLRGPIGYGKHLSSAHPEVWEVWRHGRVGSYVRGCRCYPCTEAHQVYYRAKRHEWGINKPDPNHTGYVPQAERSARVQHGTYTKYHQHGCRCDECAKWARDTRKSQRAKASGLIASRSDVPHGRASTYQNHGCRCSACTTANRIAARTRKARKRASA